MMKKGERIRKRREQLGLSQTTLADMIGESKQTLYKYESGIISNIPSNKIEALADALHVSPGWIMGWDTSSENIPDGFEPLPKTVKRPLVGSIACGEPITAEQNIEDYIEVPENIRCDFCLRCKGDSMIGAGINDGDIVYIRKQETVDTGQIAAVRIGTEATLKRLYLHPNYLELRPENAAYESIICSRAATDEIHIEGLAVGFTHWF